MHTPWCEKWLEASPALCAAPGLFAPSMLPTRIVVAVAMPKGTVTKVNSQSVSKEVCASTGTVPGGSINMIKDQRMCERSLEGGDVEERAAALQHERCLEPASEQAWVLVVLAYAMHHAGGILNCHKYLHAITEQHHFWSGLVQTCTWWQMHTRRQAGTHAHTQLPPLHSQAPRTRCTRTRAPSKPARAVVMSKLEASAAIMRPPGMPSLRKSHCVHQDTPSLTTAPKVVRLKGGASSSRVSAEGFCGDGSMLDS